MTPNAPPEKVNFLTALHAVDRAPEIPAEADIYGWLIGSWTLEVRHYLTDKRGSGLRGEAHFGRVLEGRAVQDVWIMPQREMRQGPPDPTCNMYGTTLRIWDAALQAWRVTWFNPVAGLRDQLIGRRHGADIVQIGTHADGTPIRWNFTDITDDSFRWTGTALQPDGETWKLEGEFVAKRLSS